MFPNAQKVCGGYYSCWLYIFHIIVKTDIDEEHTTVTLAGASVRLGNKSRTYGYDCKNSCEL